MVSAQPRIHPENEMHKLLWDFKIQMDHLNSARRPNLVIINKKKRTCQRVDFSVPADHRIKLKESKKADKYLDLAREQKKTMKHENDDDTNCNWCTQYGHQRISTWTRGFGNKRTSGNYLKYSIIKFGQNTEKSPGDLRRLAVTQTPVRNHHLMLV